jgi:hypothetical protein
MKPMVTAVENAMGGRANWDQARYLRFDWVVERGGKEAAHARHLWDRKTGRYRVEWLSRDGRNVVALFDIKTKAGHVWLDGKPATPTDSTEFVKRAYGRFINDSYWLLMPWKWMDPGTKLADAGHATLDGKDYYLLHLSFENVGLTPGDQYWAYVDPQTHRMDRWAYFLQGEEGQASLDKATAWTWSDWRTSGGVSFACNRTQVGGKEGERIYFPVVQVLAKVDDNVFTSPGTPLPGEPVK